MTCHVPAYTHFDALGRLQFEVRIKARHFMHPVERPAQPLRKRSQLLHRQIPASLLNAEQFLDDHHAAQVVVEFAGPTSRVWNLGGASYNVKHHLAHADCYLDEHGDVPHLILDVDYWQEDIRA